MSFGWICPRCQRVNAPQIHSCICSSGTTYVKENNNYCMDCPEHPSVSKSFPCSCGIRRDQRKENGKNVSSWNEGQKDALSERMVEVLGSSEVVGPTFP